MLNYNEILATQDMIDKRHLDIRTITMGISLLDCADEDIRRCLEAGVDFITTNEPELTRRIMKEMGIRERR